MHWTKLCLLLAVVAVATADTSAAPDVVLVGATGNLAQKYLWQILFELSQAGKVGRIIGGATKAKDVGTGLIDGIIQKKVTCAGCEDKVEAFRKSVEYVQLRRDEQYGELGEMLDKTGAPRLFFLSVSPDYYPQIAKNINTQARPKAAGAWLRVVFEKPFGRDSASARALSEKLVAELAEPEVYRIDHYLGKMAVQAVGDFRRANPAIEAHWNAEAIGSIEVVMKESETCEGRTAFYDRYGIVRDVLQNHLLELVALAMAELPPPGSAEPIDRLALLKHLKDASSAQLKLGQYEGYAAHVLADSKGKKASTNTATAATVRLEVDTSRWKGMPIFLSAGKALDERAAYVRVRFKPGHFEGGGSEPCDVLFHLQGGALGTATKVCSHLPVPKFPEGWERSYHEGGGSTGTPIEKAANPYNVLLRGVVDGRRDLFCGTDELYELWRVWTPMLAQVEDTGVKPQILPVGQPWKEAEEMMESGGVEHEEL